MKPLPVALAIAACGLVSAGLSQAQTRPEASSKEWRTTGASLTVLSDGSFKLPAGSQLSRLFEPGDSLRARVKFDTLLSAEPADLVSVQFGWSTLALTRSGALGVVFASEEQLADAPLLIVELGDADAPQVAVNLEVLVDPTGSTIRIEVGDESAEWQSRGAGDGPREFALSAGPSAPIWI